MATFYTLVFYLDTNRQERCFKQRSCFDGLLPKFVDAMLNTLRTAPFVDEHARKDIKVKVLWWGQDHWETDHDYQVSDAYESSTLILVDEDLTGKGAEHFQQVTSVLLMQARYSPKKPSQAATPEVISLKPGIWGCCVDLKALWRVVLRRLTRRK
jgi:hypothetical protein